MQVAVGKVSGLLHGSGTPYMYILQCRHQHMTCPLIYQLPLLAIAGAPQPKLQLCSALDSKGMQGQTGRQSCSAGALACRASRFMGTWVHEALNRVREPPRLHFHHVYTMIKMHLRMHLQSVMSSGMHCAYMIPIQHAISHFHRTRWRRQRQPCKQHSMLSSKLRRGSQPGSRLRQRPMPLLKRRAWHRWMR